jgi:structural maintenance of chromosome 2
VIKNKKQAVSDAELQLKKFEHDMQTLAKEKTAATNFVANLEKQYDWIQDESEYVTRFAARCWVLTTPSCSLFGQKGSPYDFAAVDIGRLKEKARELEDMQKGMKKKVNPKVINMIDR